LSQKKKIYFGFLFCLLSAAFLIIAGCWGNDETTTYTVAGTVNVYGTGDALANVTVSATGSATSSTTTGSDGNFTLSAANGTYTLTPSLANYTFDPVSTVVVVDGANITDTNFVATSTGGADTYGISGTVSGAVQSDVKLTLSGGLSGTVMTGSDGTYSFGNVVGGTTYIVTPSRSGYSFSPEYTEFTIGAANAANIDFVSSSL